MGEGHLRRDGLRYDCSDDLSALPEGIYYASAAAETDGRTAYAPIAQVESEIMPLQSPYNRMQAVSGLRWDGGTAHWTRAPTSRPIKSTASTSTPWRAAAMT